MKTYPVLFTYLEKVEGNGFLASVTANGRALLVDEEEGEGWWMYGVNPGGLAACGPTQLEARLAMRQAFMSVLFDIASEAKSFDDFRDEAQRFFDQTDADEKEWLAAVDEVRAGRVESPGLPKQPADAARGITIELRQSFAPIGNVLEPSAALAA